MGEPATAVAVPTAAEEQYSLLKHVHGAINKIGRVAEGIAELKERFAGLVADAGTKEGMATLRAARAALRVPRLEVEKVRKEAKAPILALGRQLDAEAARITVEIVKLEEPIDSQITAYEAKVEAERQADIAREEARVRAIRRQIDAIRGLPLLAVGKNATQIAALIRDLDAVLLKDFDFAEFKDEANRTATAARDGLQVALDARVRADEEAQRLDEQRAELARKQLEQVRVKAITDRIDSILRIGLRTVGADLKTLEALGEELQPLYRQFEFAEHAAEASAAYAASGKEIERAVLALHREAQAREEEKNRAAAAALEKMKTAPPYTPAQVEADDAPKVDESRAALLSEVPMQSLRDASALMQAAPIPAHVRPVSMRPTEEEILVAVATHFCVDRATALAWLRDCQFAEVV